MNQNLLRRHLHVSPRVCVLLPEGEPDGAAVWGGGAGAGVAQVLPPWPPLQPPLPEECVRLGLCG